MYLWTDYLCIPFKILINGFNRVFLWLPCTWTYFRPEGYKNWLATWSSRRNCAEIFPFWNKLFSIRYNSRNDEVQKCVFPDILNAEKNAFNDSITGETRSILYWTGTAASLEQNFWSRNRKQIIKLDINSPERRSPETVDTILLVYTGF